MFFSIFYVTFCQKSKMLTLQGSERYEIGIFLMIIGVLSENYTQKCKTKRSLLDRNI